MEPCRRWRHIGDNSLVTLWVSVGHILHFLYSQTDETAHLEQPEADLGELGPSCAKELASFLELGEGFEMLVEDRRKDGVERFVGRERDVEHAEERDEAWVHGIARSARWSACRKTVRVDDVLPRELYAIIQALAFNEELEERHRLLRAVGIDARHLLPCGRPEGAFQSLLDIAFDVHLQILAGGPARKADVQEIVFVRIQRLQIPLQRHSFRCPGVSNKHRWSGNTEAGVDNPGRPDCVGSWHQQLVEL
eukprot:1865069-Rhodomonas_salina.1